MERCYRSLEPAQRFQSRIKRYPQHHTVCGMDSVIQSCGDADAGCRRRPIRLSPFVTPVTNIEHASDSLCACERLCSRCLRLRSQIPESHVRTSNMSWLTIFYYFLFLTSGLQCGLPQPIATVIQSRMGLQFTPYHPKIYSQNHYRDTAHAESPAHALSRSELVSKPKASPRPKKACALSSILTSAS